VRAFVAAFSLLVAMSAEAQPYTLPCLPAQVGGTGTALVVLADANGMSYGWTCPGLQTPVQFWGTWDQFAANWQEQGAEIAAGGKSAADAAVNKFFIPAAKDANGAALFPSTLGNLVPPVYATLKARIPPPPTTPPPSGWVVAPTSICAAADKDASGKCVRRQSFTWDGQARGLVAQPERATVGAPCITSFGATPYFGFDQAHTDRVVACVKQ
jgi:hypothetical protein